MDNRRPLDGIHRTLGAQSENSSVRWYVLYLRCRYEKKVHEELTRCGVESFLPMITEVKQWSDRRKRVDIPLFPGYDFVRIHLRDRIKVLQVDGVVRFVATHNKPASVPDEQIAALKLMVSSPGTLRKESRIPVGSLVEVTSGPFAGVRGVVVRGEGATRVSIIVDGIQQAVSVEVPAEFLKEVAVSSVEVGSLFLLLIGTMYSHAGPVLFSDLLL